MPSEERDEKAIFNVARQIPSPEARAEYLRTACESDGDLLQRVQKLLKGYEEQASFLESPAAGQFGPTQTWPPLERIGIQIGPYKLLQQIGEGGMGTVYLAEQTQPVQRKVALKLIKPGMDSRQVIARFEAERQALAMMDHVNIARVFDGGATENGRPYFVMELVHGVPITKYCDDNHLTPRERLELFVPVCQAIQHAHQKGIIHRDIKPSNVMVTLYDGKPVPKVIDFGVAKATEQTLTERTLFTQYGTIVGTLEYMSPEQAEMSALGVDTRSDIFSLGVLLYELLTGTTPLSRKRVREAAHGDVLRMIKEEEPPRPSLRLSDSGEALASISANRDTEPAKLSKLMRGELDWIVMKTLEKDRNRRYETAKDFAADVERYLNDEPVQACPPSAGYRFRKFARRNRVAFSMASVAAVALVALGVAGISVYRNQVTEQQRLAEHKAHEERLRAEKRQNVLEKALMAALSGDLDGAEKATGEAELLGASTGQVRMLRGQVAFHRGDAGTAIQHLEQAVKLLPEGQPGSVATRAMLALAYANTSQGPRFDAVARGLDRQPPVTAEDYLFKGLVETFIRPEHGLQMLDEAVRRRDSVIARAARCEARANRALNTGEVREAELALEDAQVAKAMLPDNLLVLSRSIYSHLVAAGMYQNLGRPQDSERVLAQARRDVQELERFSSEPLAAKACFEYFDYVGDEQAAYAMSGKGNEYMHTVMLYRRGEFAKALEAADRNIRLRRGFSMDQVERGFILAELRDGPALARVAFQEAKVGSVWSADPSMILLLLGQTEEADRACLEVRKEEMPPWNDGWYIKLLDYNCGRMTGGELLQAAGTACMKPCEAHFMIGLRCLAAGDRGGARDHFTKCAATGAFMYWEWKWARAFLVRMEQDAAWPPWIPQSVDGEELSEVPRSAQLAARFCVSLIHGCEKGRSVSSNREVGR